MLQLLSDERSDFLNVPQSNQLRRRSPHFHKLCIPAGNLSFLIGCQHAVWRRFHHGSDHSQRVWQIFFLFSGIAIGHNPSSRSLFESSLPPCSMSLFALLYPLKRTTILRKSLRLNTNKRGSTLTVRRLRVPGS